MGDGPGRLGVGCVVRGGGILGIIELYYKKLTFICKY